MHSPCTLRDGDRVITRLLVVMTGKGDTPIEVPRRLLGRLGSVWFHLGGMCGSQKEEGRWEGRCGLRRLSTRKFRAGGKCGVQSFINVCSTKGEIEYVVHTVASRFTTLTTHGRASEAVSPPSVGSVLCWPKRTMWRYVICSFGETSSVLCSSRAANRIVTFTPSSASSLPSLGLPSWATTGSASTTAKAGPAMLRFWDLLRKWKWLKRRRALLRPAIASEEGRLVTKSPDDDGSPCAGLGDVSGALAGTWAFSKRPSSSKAPSSNLSRFPNPPSTTVSNTRSLERAWCVEVGKASGCVFGMYT